MAARRLELSRDYDLPPAIVWDAFVDEDLIEGWLATARIEPHEGGRFDLGWQGVAPQVSAGTIVAIEPEARLVIDTDNRGVLEFTLEGVPGGTRGLGTIVTVRVDADSIAEETATWNTNFDQLESLLRGHPVDWSTWRAERGPAWESYYREASGAR